MPITSMEIRTNHSKRLTKRLVLLASFCLSCVLVLPNCGSTSGNSTGPGTVLVTIQPASASVLLGETQTFTASVTGTANTGVTWNVNGFLGGSPAIGTISPNGIYNAPAILPSPATVTISAVSQTNIEASASVTVNLHDDIVVTLSPPSANLPTNGGQVFTATITATGSPAPGVTWSVSGISGGNTAVGTIVSNGHRRYLEIRHRKYNDHMLRDEFDFAPRCERDARPDAGVHGLVLPGFGLFRYLGCQRNHRRERNIGNHR
jgi:hypothetical protein